MSTLPLPIPNELNLTPRLAAHKYMVVCALTVITWDTLVLSGRSFRLWRWSEWSPLKILFHFLQIWMPVEFAIVAAAFFDPKWSITACQKFQLFEPICTAILLAAASSIHVIRITGLYNKKGTVVSVMSALFALQIITTAVMCGFYMSVPLLEGQGCIAGPKHIWVGIYWISPALLYMASFYFALMRSYHSLAAHPISLWNLALRDGLNLYGVIVLVHLVNVFFWFIVKPTGGDDAIRTTATSITAVLTASMSLRIVLSIRGALADGGTFTISAEQSHGGSGVVTGSNGLTQLSSGARVAMQAPSQASLGLDKGTYTLDNMQAVASTDGKSSLHEDNASDRKSLPDIVPQLPNGVKVTVSREMGYDTTVPRFAL